MKLMNLLKKNAVPIFVVVVAVTLVLYMNYKPEGFKINSKYFDSCPTNYPRFNEHGGHLYCHTQNSVGSTQCPSPTGSTASWYGTPSKHSSGRCEVRAHKKKSLNKKSH